MFLTNQNAEIVACILLVLKIEKLSHIVGPRASQDLRSPSPIMAPGAT